MNEVLQINPAFETIIPELSPDEFAQLEENIVTEQKIIDPIITWKGMIVDGHNRYKIAQKHPEIPFSVKKKKFDSENEVVAADRSFLKTHTRHHPPSKKHRK